jgi:hypothetical protein
MDSYGAYVFVQLTPTFKDKEAALKFFQKLMDKKEIADWGFVEIKSELNSDQTEKDS